MSFFFSFFIFYVFGVCVWGLFMRGFGGGEREGDLRYALSRSVDGATT